VLAVSLQFTSWTKERGEELQPLQGLVESQNIASISLQENAHQIDIDTLVAENVAESLAFPVAVQELEELCHVEAVRAAEEDAGVPGRPGA
jgi:hypothetical protein